MWEAPAPIRCNFWTFLRPTVVKRFRFGAPLHRTLSSRFVRAWPTFCLAVALISVLDARLTFAAAQTKLEATYAATLLGLPIGEISWTVDLRGNRFKASARRDQRPIANFLRRSRGRLGSWRARRRETGSLGLHTQPGSGKWSDNVRIVFSDDKAQEYVATASPRSNPDQVPLTEADPQRRSGPHDCDAHSRSRG